MIVTKDVSDLDLDPHIKGFMHVTERLSNIENRVEQIWSTLQYNEMRKIGVLNSAAFGYPFRLIRMPENLPVPGASQPRININNETEFRAAIIEFHDDGEGTQLNFREEKSGTEDEYDADELTASEMEKVLREDVKRRSGLFKVYVIWTDGYITTFGLVPRDQDSIWRSPKLTDYVDEGRKLINRIRDHRGLEYQMRLTVTPCCPGLFQLYRAVDRLAEASSDEEKAHWNNKRLRIQEVYQSLVSKSAFLRHSYFKQCTEFLNSLS